MLTLVAVVLLRFLLLVIAIELGVLLVGRVARAFPGRHALKPVGLGILFLGLFVLSEASRAIVMRVVEQGSHNELWVLVSPALAVLYIVLFKRRGWKTSRLEGNPRWVVALLIAFIAILGAMRFLGQKHAGTGEPLSVNGGCHDTTPSQAPSTSCGTNGVPQSVIIVD